MEELFIYFLFFLIYVGAQILGAIRKKQRQQQPPPTTEPGEREMTLEEALREIRGTFQGQPAPKHAPPQTSIPTAIPAPPPRPQPKLQPRPQPKAKWFEESRRPSRPIVVPRLEKVTTPSVLPSVKKTASPVRGAAIRASVQDPKKLREALVLNEVLGPPLSKRR